MAVRHRFIWKYGRAEMCAPVYTEVKEQGVCVSFILWLLDKQVFVGNTQG